jgi:hypothetical protein
MRQAQRKGKLERNQMHTRLTRNWNGAIGVGSELRESVAHIELGVLNAEVDGGARLVARLNGSSHAHLVETHGVDAASECGSVVGAVGALTNAGKSALENGASGSGFNGDREGRHGGD